MGPLYFFLTAEANLSQFKLKLVALVKENLFKKLDSGRF